MEQFFAVAAAHFLALLIPGVDFFLIARTTMSHGWRNASGACLGIALANGVFIAAAFSGLSLISHPVLLGTIQAAGGIFLSYIGVMFLRASTAVLVPEMAVAARSTWGKSLGLGFASGLLNPKNALFYVSLAAGLAAADAVSLGLYGAWMFAVVLLWDLFLAIALGSERALSKLSRFLPWMTKVAGGFLVLLGLGMVVTLVAGLWQ
ncbi:LysE family translocator [Arthrobacter glacialis]|uniref:Lysine transporter LysE n=1 Tax=Arthrobacter glacialis TaxID=1664 RepID=A0A2S3ZV24_ARTGL|nr:LysE family translocator [Arthrobacter glacialis]POH72959.1 lysine transporter LysE [Arthrobacter glacialis]